MDTFNSKSETNDMRLANGIPQRPIIIFTNEDMKSQDIAEMSNFFGKYLQQISLK